MVNKIKQSRLFTIDFLRLIVWEQTEIISLPVFICDLNISDSGVEQGNVHRTLSTRGVIAVRKVPIGTIFLVVPIDIHSHVEGVGELIKVLLFNFGVFAIGNFK